MTDKEIIEEMKDAAESNDVAQERSGASVDQESTTGESLEGVPERETVAEPDEQNEVDVLKHELKKVTDQLMRQAAEFQNYRRRTEQEKSQMVLFGKGMVLQQLLDVFDDFQRSIEASEQVGNAADGSPDVAYESLKSGMGLAYQKLIEELKKMDVEPIPSVGEPFDEMVHEAVMQQPVSDDQEVGMVLTEVQRGYRMGDRVLRHAKVIVSSRAPVNE